MNIQEWRNIYERQNFAPVSYGGMEGYRDIAGSMIQMHFYPEPVNQTIRSMFPDTHIVDTRYDVHEFGEYFEDSVCVALFYPTKNIEVILTVKNDEKNQKILFDHGVFETDVNQFRKELTTEESSQIEQLLLLCVDFIEQQGYHRLHLATHEFDYQFGAFQYVLEKRKDDKDEYRVHI